MTLPKGYSRKDESNPSSGAWLFRIFQMSLVCLSGLLAFTGLFIILFLAGQESSEEHRENWEGLVVFSFASWIVGIPILLYIIRKRRTLEITNPTGFTQLYFRRREPHQCTICQKHPVSKKYHIKSVHGLKNVNEGDYFKDCGCDKCAKYDKSEAG